ncbi:MAG: TonB-dependent receptor [Granulicella sp.]
MHARFLRRLVSTIAIGIAISTAITLAQSPGTGAITGTVYDPTGLSVSGAQVLVTNEATHSLRYAVTTSSGVFTASLLVPGTYSVAVDVPGFQKETAHAIPVVVSEVSSLAFRLSIAQLGQSVQVVADTEIAQTHSSALGRAVDEQAIMALPLANRNYTQILSLSPGVSVALPDAAELGRGSQNVSANGNKPTANNIQFNGIDSNNLAQNSAKNDNEEVGVAVPAPDTIEEFKVQTGNYDAAYGRGTGANIDAISKAGTNRFHGSAWEFIRNDAFNANDFFSKLDGQAKPVLKHNQFGASLGGPILHDKTFFFAAYQRLQESNGLAAGSKVTVFLPQLTSDRAAATLGAQFCPDNHPGNEGYLTHAGGVQVNCSGSNINPVALKLLNLKLANGQFAVPSPQILLPTDPGQFPIGQSTFSIPAQYKEDQYTANLDQIISGKNQISARFFYSRAPTIKPFSSSAANVPGWGTNELDENAMLVLADTHVFNPNLVNIARFGYLRFAGVASVANPVSTADLGTVSPTDSAGADIHAPGITVDGLFTVGDAGTAQQSQVTNSFIWQDTVSLTRGRHFFRTGVEVKRHQVELDAPFSTDGLLDIRTFSDLLLGLSAAPVTAEGNGSPDGFSNVTLSNGSSGLFRKDERYTDFSVFFQDDIRASSRLTFNAGVRYEIFGAPMEIHGRLATFDPTIATPNIPASGSLSGFLVPSNFQGSVPNGVIKTSYPSFWPSGYHDVSPRVGFVLSLNARSSALLRGGYGMYFDRLSAGLVESTVTQPPFSTFQFISDASNGGASLAHPFSPVLPPTSAYPTFTQRVPGGVPTLGGVSPHVTDPYTHEYNLNFQLALAHNYLLELGYVGTRSVHVSGCAEFNQAQLASPQNPINGETMNTAANVVQRVPFEGVGPGSLICQTSYTANYNSLQTSITKRLSHGLQFLGSYTWSKALDQTSGSGNADTFESGLITNDQNNPAQAYGLADYDRANRGVFNLVYQTPTVLRALRPARLLLANWQLSAIFVVQSGSPLTISDSNAGLVYGNYENRAPAPISNPQTSGSLSQRAATGYLDSSAFPDAPEAPNGSGPGDTDFGNSSVGFLRGPWQRNIDAALERSFPIADSVNFRFRAEFFNLTNTPNFGNPDINLRFGSFGKISSTSNPRIIQFAGKILF